ncbi:MAG: hypothetical protein IH991_16020, partial [Planctomycetes bacterium]|nr:hypothetical protein [Planctomycetota bacterium]
MVSVLFWLVVGVVLVTVVGHGLWLLFAAMFGGAKRTQQDPTEGQRVLRRLLERGAIGPDEFERFTWVLNNPFQQAKQQANVHAFERPPLPGQVEPPPVQKQTASDGDIVFSSEPPPIGSPVAVTKPTEVVVAEVVTPALPELPVAVASRKEVHILDVKEESTDAAEDPPRRRRFSDLLHAFMEERNIRWGELLSGVLIIGSAVGLVISLRHTLSQAIPYFPALLFMGGTAAIH